GDADFNVSATASSGLSVSFGATGNCSVSGNTVHITGAGSCTITASQAGDSNYNAATPVQRSFNIAKVGQTITFGALSAKTFGDASFTVNATGGASGNPVTFSSQTPATCSVSGSAVTILSVGTCTVRASQAGNSNYNAATPVDQSFTINQATATIALSNLSQSYDGAPKAPTAVTTPAGLSVTFTYMQNGQVVTSPTNVGSYNVTATITDPNYQGSITGILVINRATPVIAWSNPANIVFGTPLSATQLNATANTAGAFTYNPPAGTVLNVGPHQLSVTFTPTDTTNYTTATANVSITIDPVTAAALNLDSATYTVNEADGYVTIMVNRTGSGSGAASVDYKTSDTAALQDCNVFNGIASSRCDYATTVGTLRFNAGEVSKTIFIPVVDDSYAEGAESFTITLSNAVGENLGAVSTATITITDNEAMNGSNPIATIPFFVRQQYIDFLGRDPDPAGFTGWQNILSNCAAGDTNCDRIAVSSGFFRSPEFQDRGYFVFRFYAAALGRNPSYAEFMPDLAKVSGFLTEAQLEANKVAFITEFMARTEYVNKYGSLSNAAYVDALLQTAGLPDHPMRGSWIDALNNNTATRAQALRAFVESLEIYNKFYNQAFVVMQYFGYLRRDPDSAYTQWIDLLNQTGDYRTLINGFLNSNEYVRRFGP
ncbi:MAG TPA: MBG domain-containing protein, partial [Pyrinomonadaceae bacterium]